MSFGDRDMRFDRGDTRSGTRDGRRKGITEAHFRKTGAQIAQTLGVAELAREPGRAATATDLRGVAGSRFGLLRAVDSSQAG